MTTGLTGTTTTRGAEVENYCDKATQYLDALGVTAGLDPAHKLMFVELCARMGLNPLLREVYAIPYENRSTGKVTLSVIVGYQEFIKRAERTGLLNSWRVDIEGDVVKEVVTKQMNGKNGTYQKDAVVLHGDMKAVITIWRKDWTNPFVHEVYLEEYAQPNEMWATKPKTMLKKVAITQGFRMAFPLEICAGAYGAEEIAASPIQEVEYTVVTPATPAINPEPKSKSAEVRQALKAALEHEKLTVKQMAAFAEFYELDLRADAKDIETVSAWLANPEALAEKIDTFFDSLDEAAAAAQEAEAKAGTPELIAPAPAQSEGGEELF